MSATTQAIKKIIQDILPGAEVILFGSRARNDNREDSDWDVLVITPRKLDKKEDMEVWSKIHKTLVWQLDIACDLLMYSKQEVEDRRILPGHVVRWALKEGVQL